MSCYEWERGTFKLSGKEYRKFKKEFLRRWNVSMDEAYANALKIHAGVLAANKGKRNVNWDTAIREFPVKTTTMWSIGHTYTYRISQVDHGQLIWRSLGVKFDGSAVKRPCKPKKKDFPHATNKTNSYSTEWRDGEVIFYDDRRVVHWHVGENNHACEHARSSIVGKIFFDLLGKVEWTRGTGGEIVGNDEYSRESHDVGGGANYVKDSWGPKQQKEQRASESRYSGIAMGFHW